MITVFKKLFLLSIFLLIFLPAGIVEADTGPKPTMEFEFQQELAGEPVTIIWGTLYECEHSDCSDAAPLEELGPQGFSCSVDRCDAMAYGFAPYHKLEIGFSDGQTRQSNVFETAGFNSIYGVTVRPGDLLVESRFSSSLPPLPTAVVLLGACLLCGGVLLAALIIFFLWRSYRK